MSIQNLFSENEIKILQHNHEVACDLNIFEPNFVPIVALKASKLGYKFLVTQLVSGDNRAVFCLSDYGDENLRLEVIDLGATEKKIEDRGDVLVKDEIFIGKHNLAVYAKVADRLGKIVLDDSDNKARQLFEKFKNESKYTDPAKNLRKFRFDHIW